MNKINSNQQTKSKILFSNFIQKIINNFSNIGKKYQSFLEIIQISFVYLFAFIDLFHSILNNVFLLGYFPEILRPFFPTIKMILLSPLLRAWCSPEKVFFFSYIIIEFLVVRKSFKFSKLVRYNILLVFSLLMIQGLVLSYWDLLFHRDVVSPMAKWSARSINLIGVDKRIAVFLFFTLFIVFSVLYTYLYICALQGKFTKILGLSWLTDSVSILLRIKTPTMRSEEDIE